MWILEGGCSHAASEMGVWVCEALSRGARRVKVVRRRRVNIFGRIEEVKMTQAGPLRRNIIWKIGQKAYVELCN